jgi:hypothetical protein
MQITDIHLGEAENTDWGPEQDYRTWNLLHKMLTKYESSTNFIVLGGDQLTANNCLHNCTEYYKLLGKFLTQYDIPWATVLGNHDDMTYVPSDNVTNKAIPPHVYTRRDLIKIDQSFPNSLSKLGPTHVTGASNFVLDILDLERDELAVQMYFFDSGGGSIPEAFDTTQVQWFKQQLSESSNKNIPAIAFQHIPVSGHVYSDSCTGYRGQGVELIQDYGLVDAMVESGRFHFLGVGHNHGNDYCCPYNNTSGDKSSNNTDLYFCFGRHSGYGGYGNWQRGVRMYELLLTDDDDDDDGDGDHEDTNKKIFKWRTWVSVCLSSDAKYHSYIDF